MSDITQLQQILQSTGEGLVRDIASSLQVPCDFVVSVALIPDFDITISKGYPPTITISSSLILGAIFNDDPKVRKKTKNRIHRIIFLALGKLPRMVHTLSNEPPAEMIALKDGKFHKTNYPEDIIFKIPLHHLEISYTHTITVREIITNQSVTMTGESESLIRAKAIAQLTSIVSMNKALQEEMKNHEKPFEPDIEKILIRENVVGPEIHYEFTPEPQKNE